MSGAPGRDQHADRALPAPGDLPRRRRRRRAVPEAAAKYLRRAGVAKIQGFFLNATHFDWTSNEIKFGEKISRLTGGKHFVVNTGDERPGSAASRTTASTRATRSCATRPDVAWDRCRPPTPASRTWTRSRGSTNPGESGGPCRAGRAADRRVLARLRPDARPTTRTSSSLTGQPRAIVPHPTTSSPSIRQAS